MLPAPLAVEPYSTIEDVVPETVIDESPTTSMASTSTETTVDKTGWRLYGAPRNIIFRTDDWNNFNPIDWNGDVGFELTYPARWTLQGTTFRVDGKKVAELSPPGIVALYDNQHCFSGYRQQTFCDCDGTIPTFIQQDSVKYGNRVLVRQQYSAPGGESNHYCFEENGYAFKMAFYDYLGLPDGRNLDFFQQIMASVRLLKPEAGFRDWRNEGWPYRVKVTIDRTKVAGELEDFPVYVDLADMPAGFHTNVRSDGGDIRVTKGDGVTELPREVVSYNPNTNSGELHVLHTGILANSTDTDLYIYYGSSTAADYAVNDAYGRNQVWKDYYFVQHREVDGLDSTGKAAWTDSNSPAYNPGKIGNSIDFSTTIDKNSQGMDVSALYDTDLTIQHWFSVNRVPTSEDYFFVNDAIITRGDAAKTFSLLYLYDPDDDALNLWWVKANYNGVHNYVIYPISLPTNTWHLSHWVYDNNTNFEGFLDGVSRGSVSNPGDDPRKIRGSYDGISIGSNVKSTHYSSVKVDEYRVRASVLSDAWITTEYSNQNSPGTFYNVGGQEST